MIKGIILSKAFFLVYFFPVNSIKPGSNSKATNKNSADCSQAVCLGVK